MSEKKRAIFILIILFLLSGQIARAENRLDTSKEYAAEYQKIERRLEYNPDNLESGNRLREICRENDIVSLCIDTFNGLSAMHPKNKIIRYHAALAYVDKVPGHTLFRQGWFSTRSMDHMSAVLKSNPSDWSAFYIRGLNGIFWPNSFRKLPGSIRDLKKCIEISEKIPAGLRKPYHVLAYIALGDAYVKHGEMESAISIYKQGQAVQASAKIEKRLSLDKEELESYVAEVRDRNRPTDTDITFLLDGGLNKL